MFGDRGHQLRLALLLHALLHIGLTLQKRVRLVPRLVAALDCPLRPWHLQMRAHLCGMLVLRQALLLRALLPVLGCVGGARKRVEVEHQLRRRGVRA